MIPSVPERRQIAGPKRVCVDLEAEKYLCNCPRTQPCGPQANQAMKRLETQ
jgi:hypothetical protein